MDDVDAREFLRDVLLKAPSPERAVTIQFRKRRVGPDRELHALRWVDEAGDHRRFDYVVGRDAAGAWQIRGGWGGGGGPTWDSHPRRGRPWVKLGCLYGTEGLFAGGEVCEDDGRVARVRLLDGGDLLDEDTVEGGVVLFMSYRPAMDLSTIVAELYDAAGALVGTHPPWRRRPADPPAPEAACPIG